MDRKYAKVVRSAITAPILTTSAGNREVERKKMSEKSEKKIGEKMDGNRNRRRRIKEEME